MRLFCALLMCLILAAACAGPSATPEVQPDPTLTPVPTITPLVRPTLPPTFTPAPASPAPPATETAVLISPLTGLAIEAPVDLELPAGWRSGYDTLVYSDLGELSYVPLGLFTGPVTGGEATIVLLWNFRSVTGGNPVLPPELQPEPSLWLDGLRLLRLLVIEPQCNIGTGPESTYRVGGRAAVGTQFAAVDCQDNTLAGTLTPLPTNDPNDPLYLPDTRGWFAALEVDAIYFAFYVYADPISAMDGPAQAELQAILDSVQFRVGDFHALLTEVAPTSTP